MLLCPSRQLVAHYPLSGLEGKIRPKTQYRRDKEKTNVVAYADDFIITAASAELLKEKVMPKLGDALKTVGLELSLEKTKITAIEDGFDFLGFNIRKYKCQLARNIDPQLAWNIDPPVSQ